MGQADAGCRKPCRGRAADWLAHRVKLKNNVAHGAVVRWSDVAFDANSETVKTRQAMEATFPGFTSPRVRGEVGSRQRSG